MRKERRETMKMRLSDEKYKKKRVKQREQQRKRMCEYMENRKRKKNKTVIRKEENIHEDREWERKERKL